MTRDLADTVKGLREKLAAAIIETSGKRVAMVDHDRDVILDAIEPAIRELIAQEREACAKVADKEAARHNVEGGDIFSLQLAESIAEDIRARGGKS
jgi:hypothetical protein